jgi:nicotinamide-nucleotide amidase
VIVTGGLGPTDDDMMRLALADALGGESLVEDAAAFRAIAAWYERSGRTPPPSARAMALRPASARALDNAVGSAPGLAARIGSADIFCVPGPPAEMRDAFDRHIIPCIRHDAARAVAMRVLPTIGLGESDVAQRLGPLMARDRNPLVGTTASSAVVTCRVRYEGPPAARRRHWSAINAIRGLTTIASSGVARPGSW